MTGEGCITTFLSLVMEWCVSSLRGLAAPADFRSVLMNYLLPVVFLLSSFRLLSPSYNDRGYSEDSPRHSSGFVFQEFYRLSQNENMVCSEKVPTVCRLRAGVSMMAGRSRRNRVVSKKPI